MPQRVPFIRKLLRRLDRLDRQSIQNYILGLVRESNTYEEILNELSEGLLIVSREGDIRFANSRAVTWLGLSGYAQGRGHVAQAADQEFSRFILSHLSGLQDKTVGNLRLIAPRELKLQVSLMPLKTPQHEDVLVLLQENMREGERDSKHQPMEALVSLAAGIAHEIGNPLNAIAIHLALLKKEVGALPESKQKSFQKTLDVLNSETSRLDKIIKNFLRATRKPPLRFRSEDLNEVLDEAVSFMRPELEVRGIHTRFRRDTAIPFFLMDRMRLYQAFINLIKNAMEAMEKGGQLTIQTSHKDRVALVQFKDEGSGIEEADLPHIFEAYYTTKEAGTGLGLMTVFNTVSEHGGRIEVVSKVGKGTTFTLLLPIRQPKLQLTDKN